MGLEGFPVLNSVHTIHEEVLDMASRKNIPYYRFNIGTTLESSRIRGLCLTSLSHASLWYSLPPQLSLMVH
jgi:hypothetical protein